VAPTDGSPGLTAGDLRAKWLTDQGYEGPMDQPLFRTGLTLYAYIDAGALSATMELPIAADTVAEPVESVRLVVPRAPDPTNLTDSLWSPAFVTAPTSLAPSRTHREPAALTRAGGVPPGGPSRHRSRGARRPRHPRGAAGPFRQCSLNCCAAVLLQS
jgi:hypothetical protein